jgi:hypothetical protein
MLWVGADHHHLSFSPNQTAINTNFFYRGADFHIFLMNTLCDHGQEWPPPWLLSGISSSLLVGREASEAKTRSVGVKRSVAKPDRFGKSFPSSKGLAPVTHFAFVSPRNRGVVSLIWGSTFFAYTDARFDLA